ncbi:MAG: hypothetical protein QM535_19485 [Limnohabitans sp.]|nr:hypothetical protein [Limnohabitans sp.]
MNDKPKFNPQLHHRRSIRLPEYDYSQSGLYFITICCHSRECIFGKIENNKMILNEYGTIAYNEWIKLTERFSNFELDVFQIMPNHMHGIIALNDVGAGFTPAPNNDEIYGQSPNGQPEINTGQPQGLPLQITDNDNRATLAVAPTIGDIVGAYKSLVANKCLKIWKTKWVGSNPVPTMGKLWQRNYYEHIIRNEKSYLTISKYIINNPAKWQEDKFYKNGI